MPDQVRAFLAPPPRGAWPAARRPQFWLVLMPTGLAPTSERIG